MEVIKEMLDKAKEAKSPQELWELAKAEGIELTEEAAAEAFKKLHEESGELSDEELENVAGGVSDMEWWVTGEQRVKMDLSTIAELEKC